MKGEFETQLSNRMKDYNRKTQQEPSAREGHELQNKGIGQLNQTEEGNPGFMTDIKFDRSNNEGLSTPDMLKAVDTAHLDP